MIHRYCAENDRIKIRPLKYTDIELLRQWRNDEKLSLYLSKIPYITPEKQQEWYNSYLKDSNSIFFAVIERERNVVIGSVALYDFKEHQCAVGKIVIGDKLSQGKGAGYSSLILALVIAIARLAIRTVTLDVHEGNIKARAIYEKAGFKVVGRHSFIKGGYEEEMEIKAEDFFTLNEKTKNIRIDEEEATVKNGDRNRGGIFKPGDIVPAAFRMRFEETILVVMISNSFRAVQCV